jgi:hypothetical protein
MRSGIITRLQSQLTSTIKCASELPWSQNGQPLYLKNMRWVYVDQPRQEQTTLLPTLNGGEVFQNDQICSAYLAVDAKNPPSGLDTAVSTILAAKAYTGVVNFGSESDYTVEQQEDVLIYTFEFRINIATT